MQLSISQAKQNAVEKVVEIILAEADYYKDNKISAMGLRKRINIERKELEEMTRQYAEGFLPDYNDRFFSYFAYFGKKYFRPIFRNVKVEGEEHISKIQQISREKSKILVYIAAPHATLIDTLFLPYVMNKMGLQQPNVPVAGANLFKGIANYLLPAINISRFDRAKATDWHYQSIVERGNENILMSENNILAFIQPGRSYNGQTNPPKRGLIISFSEIQRRNPNLEIFIESITDTPILVPEDKSLVRCFKSGKKMPDTDLFKEWLRFNKEYKKYKGKTPIYVKLHEPIPLQRYMENFPAKKIAEVIFNETVSDMKITKNALFCQAVIDEYKEYNSVNEERLKDRIESEAERLKKKGRDLEKNLEQPRDIESVKEFMISRQAINSQYEILNYSLLKFYSNMTAHLRQ